MTDDVFDRIRRRRSEALEAAARRAREHFSPFHSPDIIGVAQEPDATDASRVVLTLFLADGRREVLPRFYEAHARHLHRVNAEERVEYLRSIWLPYSSELLALRKPG